MTDQHIEAEDRRQFLDLAQREVLSTRRYGKSLSVAIFSADKFDRIKRRHGQGVSEEVQRILCLICREYLRNTDIFVRFGEGRLAILLPEAGEASAEQLAERLRIAVLEVSLPTARGVQTFTASLGVATATGEATDLKFLLNLAAGALREAGEVGGNIVKARIAEEKRVRPAKKRRRRIPGEASSNSAAAELTQDEIDALLKP